jgi:hypothetical protein
MVLIVSSTTRLLRGRFTFTSEGTKYRRIGVVCPLVKGKSIWYNFQRC